MKLTDNARANSLIRLANIEMLESLGFEPSGLPSRSGELYLLKRKTKTIIMFGVRCNVARKYFSLAKSFETLEQAQTFFESIKLATA